MFIGKDEAYIMNRKKKERVPSNVAAPIVYTPMEVDAINQVAELQQPNFLTAGVVSVEDRSKGAETVRPQLGERCEKITTKREPREARDEQSAVTGLHVPRWMSRKTTPQGPCGCCHHARGIGRSREKTMRVANIENNSLNWVSISSAGALDMTNCDFTERRARDEMRHIIGSSEPDVIIGSDKDRNRGCQKKDKNHVEFLCELYEAQAAQGRYFVHELTSEASSRMKCMGKIMAMAGTRAAVADLCMFGLAACDDG